MEAKAALFSRDETKNADQRIEFFQGVKEGALISLVPAAAYFGVSFALAIAEGAPTAVEYYGNIADKSLRALAPSVAVAMTAAFEGVKAYGNIGLKDPVISRPAHRSAGVAAGLAVPLVVGFACHWALATEDPLLTTLPTATVNHLAETIPSAESSFEALSKDAKGNYVLTVPAGTSSPSVK